jgi:hypothetical protein
LLTPEVALSTSDWIFLSGVIVNGLAFVGVIVSLLLLRAQGLTARDATLAVAYQNMAAQMADVARFSLTTPICDRTSSATRRFLRPAMSTTACSL